VAREGRHAVDRDGQREEALLAFVLERRATKQEILQLYLNEIYLGQAGSFSINGVGEAARVYFQKDVGNVSLPEAALLAGMIRAPNPYNPSRHPRRAMERRENVERLMQKIEAADAVEQKWEREYQKRLKAARRASGSWLVKLRLRNPHVELPPREGDAVQEKPGPQA